ncbi:MAG: TMEM165/GDT1 family protein [Magnetococcales bacterium]|nr:TMEM165/GDT1 family protein [Magnetococcales bacterium]MBF0150906.1 TMEM165/GDT1 family protein [Magnetococcales bacterium]MBF0347457.1 TMEM165/GDT1 family protein [Magnetococcales bacterium]MBF0631452.1 TMEM165/GDT1 family protein [Magnetococcales bacterium]
MTIQFETILTEFLASPFSSWLATIGTSFLTIFLAELGDKSQLVCMTLAARYRGGPIILGAMIAFAILNALAVVFGAALTQWIPESWLIIGVALLFAFFGIQALRASGAEEGAEGSTAPLGRHGVFMTTFLMIFLAELGDKTQIAAAGLAVTAPAFPVWIGATLGEGCSVLLAVVVGQKWLHRVAVKTVQRVSGLFFLLLAGLALTRLW